MKYLVEKLGDGKKYTFTTFSVTETIGLQKHYRSFEDHEDEANQIKYVTDDKGNFVKENGSWVPKERLTKIEKNRLYEMEDAQLAFMCDVIRKSLCKKHPEFKSHPDKEKDAEIVKQITDMIDANDMKNLTQFAFKGIYIREKDTIELELNEDTDDTAK